MRFVACLILSVLSLPALAQDPGMMAAQQAAQQANQQAMQAAQQANQQAMQASQQANQDAMWAAQQADSMDYGPVRLPRPKFSVKSGTYASPQTVRLTESARGATIYYTTDGWTPAPLSHPYDGPITITRTTHLQAIAVVPGEGHSLIAEAEFVFPSAPAQPVGPVVVGADGILRKGTEIPLEFASDVGSKTAQVGDKVTLQLASPIQYGSQIIEPSRAAAQATVIHVDRNGAAGAPGVLTVRVDTLTVDGVVVPLSAVETREGKDHRGKVLSTAWIPVVGMASVAEHGEQAEIDRGTPITARVVADTQIAAKSATVVSPTVPPS